jgi:signal transduction histidine kinase
MGWDTNSEKARMRSLNWKLAGALLLVVAVSIGLMAYLINVSTSSEFRQYASQRSERYAEEVAGVLGSFYERDPGWTDIDELLANLLRSTSDRLVLTDSGGIVIADTGNEWVGDTATDVGLSGGTAVVASGEDVGEVYLFSATTGGGRGFGYGGGTQQSSVSNEGEFLDRVNMWLVVVAMVAAAIALALGIILTWYITRPIKALVRGAHQVAQGNLAYRVDVRSKDELGDLGHSFNTMAASLERAETERRRMIADITHELRTPLTVIEGTVDGIEDGVFKADKEHLDAIKEQTALLTRLTADLRDLSMAESGQLKLQWAATDLIDLVRRKLQTFAAPAQDKGIELVSNLAQEVPKVKVDPTRIEQVLGNLMTNAIRHTPTGGKITVSARMIDRDMAHGVDTHSAVISVADTGEGISLEHLPHVFERFYRVEESRSRGEGGAGLGLAIAQQMVEAHGGRVWVESEIGKGSTFFVALPL